jgi:hypothetical protein
MHIEDWNSTYYVAIIFGCPSAKETLRKEAFCFKIPLCRP